MGKSLDKLVAIASGAIADGSPTVELTNSRLPPALVSELSQLLAVRNGFLAFESALHLYAVQSIGGVPGLADWNTSEVWKQEYGDRADRILCFAQDIFGNQFSLAENGVVLFECETGKIDSFAPSIEAWAEKLLADYDFVTGHTFARDWQKANRPLALGERLFPVKPFVIGGGYEIGNLKAMAGAAVLRYFGRFSAAITGKPDGTSIDIRAL